LFHAARNQRWFFGGQGQIVYNLPITLTGLNVGSVTGSVRAKGTKRQKLPIPWRVLRLIPLTPLKIGFTGFVTGSNSGKKLKICCARCEMFNVAHAVPPGVNYCKPASMIG